MAWSLDKIVAAVNAAAVDPSQWDAAMETVATEAGARGAVLLPLRGRVPIAPVSDAIRPALERYVSDGWVHRDYRAEAIPTVLSRGAATDLDILSADEMRHVGYYQEFLAPFNLQWAGLVGLMAGDDPWAISIQRTSAEGPFQPSEIEKLVKLGAHLSAASTMAKALGFARAEGVLTAFDLSDTAALMLNITGEVIKMNSRAEALLGPDVMISNRRLRSFWKPVTEILDQAITRVLMRADSPTAPAIALPRTVGRPITAYVLRADTVAMEVLSPARAFVLLVDPDRNIIPAIADLKGAFGLTKSESRLVIELQSGVALAEAAANINTTYETVRTTLKQIFRKTETKSQADLLRLVSKLRTSQMGFVGS